MSLRRILAYAAIYLLWGATFLAVRTVVLVTPPFAAAGARFLLSGLILLAVSRLEKAPWPSSADWRESAKLGFCMFTINYACFFWAEQRLFSGIASILVATTPVWILVAETFAARRFLLSPQALLGTVCGVGGIALVSLSGKTGTAPRHQTQLAILVLLFGTMAWAFGSVWSRTLALPAQQSVRSALQMTSGGLFLTILAVVSGESRQMPAALRLWTPVTLLCFVYLVVASILAFTAYVWLLQHEPAGRVATYAYINPLVALALGLGLAHESISLRQVGGILIVLLGVFLTLRQRTPA